MRLIRSAALAVMCALLMSAPLLNKVTAGLEAGVQQPGTKVNYAPIPSGEYKIDPAHSVIGFAIRHYEISLVRGRFKDFTGTIRYDDADVSKSSVEFAAKIESIDTGVDARNAHLRTADFFDAAKHPEMTFKSTRVERGAQDQYVLHAQRSD
jgi:polyisoprenoid-binding protein YceI